STVPSRERIFTSGTVGPRDQKKAKGSKKANPGRVYQYKELSDNSVDELNTASSFEISSNSADRSTFNTDPLKDLILETPTGKKLKESYAKLTVMK
ncbi:hypothetical protein MMC22_010021, partial [Lobaria immixta]|nr:hypothetical protein [Lobaria immixta]